MPSIPFGIIYFGFLFKTPYAYLLYSVRATYSTYLILMCLFIFDGFQIMKLLYVNFPSSVLLYLWGLPPYCQRQSFTSVKN
jgi:hypothetical protein